MGTNTEAKDPAPDDIYEEAAKPKGGLSRRTAMKVAGAAGAATVGYFWFREMGDPKRSQFIRRTEASEPGAPLREWERRTLAAAQDRLLPSEPGSPGASDVNAVGYIDGLMDTPYLADYSKQLIRWGIGEIHRRARLSGARTFAEADTATQDTILQAMETSGGGVRWLAKVLSYTLEGFFGDPVHGSNPGGVAWKWIEHRPGFPRPTTPNWRPEGR